jgi:hypothetical protein
MRANSCLAELVRAHTDLTDRRAPSHNESKRPGTLRNRLSITCPGTLRQPSAQNRRLSGSVLVRASSSARSASLVIGAPSSRATRVPWPLPEPDRRARPKTANHAAVSAGRRSGARGHGSTGARRARRCRRRRGRCGRYWFRGRAFSAVRSSGDPTRPPSVLTPRGTRPARRPSTRWCALV